MNVPFLKQEIGTERLSGKSGFLVTFSWSNRVLAEFVKPLLIVPALVAVLAVSIHSAELDSAVVGWNAGVGRANITPQQPMWMAGYASRNHPADGTRADLWAKALLLEDAEGDRCLLLTLDLVGIDRDLSLAVCNSIQQRHRLERKDIAICTSHTHTGPVVAQNLAPMHRGTVPERQQKLIDQYAHSLHASILDAVEQAFSDLQSCSLRQGIGNATFATNRRDNRPEDIVPGRRATKTLAGPVDHDVPVLAVRDSEENLKSVVFGYACHATVLSDYHWSGDYPGFAQSELEHLYPGCQAMFWAGCGADQNPLPRRTVALAQHYGRQLAGAVDAVLLTTEMNEIEPDLQTEYSEIQLQFGELPTRQSLLQAERSTNKYEQLRARMLLDQIDAGQPLKPTYPYPIGVWKLGDDLQMIILGGEVVVDYALRLKEELQRHDPERRVWVAAYANDVMAYIPSRRILREGGYEGGGAMVYYGLPTIWDPTVERAIVTEVHRQVSAHASANKETTKGNRGAPPEVNVTNVRRVFHNGQHNAFTDLVQFRGRYYLTFRSCPDGHMVHPTASIIILTSDDLQSWNQIHQFQVEKRDTRDPHFLVFNDRLFLYTGTWYSGETTLPRSEYDLNKHLGYAVWSADGATWSPPVMLEGTHGHYIWRASAYGGKAYLCGRRKHQFDVRPRGEGPDVESAMLESDDGLIWRTRTLFQATHGDETAFRFNPDGSILAVGRRGSENAQILRSSPPYRTWDRRDLDRYIGGPLLTRWDDRWVVGGRKNTEQGSKTAMYWLVGDELHEFAQLPSGGDNSYPGFLELAPVASDNGEVSRAVMSWYSSHEKDSEGNTITAIYLADLTIDRRLSN